jgi:hypothetical protein
MRMVAASGAVQDTYGAFAVVYRTPTANELAPPITRRALPNATATARPWGPRARALGLGTYSEVRQNIPGMLGRPPLHCPIEAGTVVYGTNF